MNSTNSDGPQIISDFYLTVLLDSIRQNGYTIFVVEGQIPYVDPEMFKGQLKKTQFYFTVEQIKKTNEKRNKEKNNEINLSGYDRRDMNKMLEKARREEAAQFGGDYIGQNRQDDEGPKFGTQKPPEPKFFEGKGTTFGGATPTKALGWYDGDQDPDTIACIKMSLQDVNQFVTRPTLSHLAHQTVSLLCDFVFLTASS